MYSKSSHQYLNSLYSIKNNLFLEIGEVVCRPCYQKKYSCTSYALSGADTLKLLDTTTIKVIY